MAQLEHQRTVYNFVSFIGDLGGVLELLLFIFGILLFPWNEHSFFVKVLNKLFVKNKKAGKVHPKNGDEETESPTKITPEKNDSENSIELSLSYCDSLAIFFNNLCCCGARTKTCREFELARH